MLSTFIIHRLFFIQPLVATVRIIYPLLRKRQLLQIFPSRFYVLLRNRWLLQIFQLADSMYNCATAGCCRFLTLQLELHNRWLPLQISFKCSICSFAQQSVATDWGTTCTTAGCRGLYIQYLLELSPPSPDLFPPNIVHLQS